MFRRWLWLKFGSTRGLFGRSRKRPQIEVLEDRFLMNADSPLVNLQSLYHNLPLSFEANQGQYAPEVQFTSSGPGYTLFLTPASAYLSLQQDQVNGAATPALVQMQLLGANAHAHGMGLDLQDYASNYLVGNDPSQWFRDIDNFGRIKYSDVYKGIDIIYYGNARELEYDFVVAPGANPDAIALAFPGTPNLRLDAAGNLVINTSGGDVIERAPVLYQMHGTQRTSVSGSYVIGADNNVRFQIGAYDHSLPLVIDPVMSYATYLGGSGADNGQSVAVDGTGNVYVTGFTGSVNFPIVGAMQGNLGGQGNVFVAKINPAGNGLVYSTYVGGGGLDLGLALRVDIAGNAYVAGTTTSGNFPVVNAIQGAFGGGSDGFVFKLNSSGSQLVFSTYLGGSAVEFAQGLALDGSSNIYVTGFTYSTNFPTANAMQPQSAGGQDAWVAKIASSGTSLIYSTYLGGTRDESAQAIGIDASGNVYVVGDTYSSNFPMKNSLQSYAGGDDGFFAKLNPAGSAILFATYLGGSGDDRASGIRLDASGNVYVLGSTSSNNFPTSNALQPTFGGLTDVFLTKFNAGSYSIAFSTYLGGSDIDQAMALAIDGASNLYLVGFTSSANFPTVNPAQSTHGGGDGDAFVAKISGSGSNLIYSTFFGGNGDDRAMGVAVDGLGNIYVVGTTASNNMPTSNALQPGFGGSFDGFVLKLSQAPATQLGVTAPASVAGNTFSITISALDSQGNPAGDYTGTIRFTSSDPLAILPPNYTFTAADRGVHTFTGLQLRSVGTQSITATDITNNSIVGSRTGIAVGAAAASFTFTGVPSVTTAGTPISVTITARDAQGNIATGYTGIVRLATSDPRGVVPAEYQFTPSDRGVHTFTFIVLKTPGSQSITATDTTLPNIKGTQPNITVNASATSLATQFLVTMPSPINSGSPVSITITALDLTKALAADYRGTIRFSSSDSSAILPPDYTFTAADQGSHTFRATFQSVQPLTVTIVDVAKASITGNITNVRVNPPVGQFVVTPSVSSVLAGTPFNVTVTAQDILLGTANGYQGTIHFTSNDPLAGLPTDYTFTAADQGSHTFQVTLRTGGGRSIIATDTTTSTLKGSTGVSVTTTAVGVVFSGLGQNVPAGTAQSVTLTVVDAQGNTVPNYIGTIRLTSSDGQAVLPANYTFTAADQGKHTFQVTFRTPGAQTLTATDVNTTSIKATTNVTVTAVAQLVVLSSIGQTAVAGTPQTVTVTLTDNLGNVATGYVGKVRFTSTDGNAVLPGEYTFTEADQGKHTFQITFKTTGAQSITVADTVSSTLKAAANLTVTTTAQILTITGLATSMTAGSQQTVTVTLTDSFGNIATGYVGTVHFASTDGQAILPANYTFTAADQGKRTFQVTLKTSGAQSITVNDTTTSSIQASASTTVNSSAQLVVLTGLTQNAVAGTVQTVTVTLTDSFGNVATNYTGKVRFTSTDGKAVLPADYTFTAADQGKHTFQVTFKTTGAQTLTVTDTATSTLKATASVSVTTTAQVLAFSGLAQNASAGSVQSLTVTLTDAFGNIATGYVGTVHFTSTDGRAVLPADYKFTAADQGKRTFQVTFKTTGTQSLSATDATNSSLTATSALTVTTVAQVVAITGLGQAATAGAPQTVTVTLTDSFGNIATSYVGSIHFTSSDGQAVLPADYTFTAADQGQRTFQVTFKTSGAQSLTITDKATSAIAGTANLNVTTSAQNVTLTGLPQSALAGAAQSFTVAVTDAFGNVITGYVGTIHFTSTDGQAGLPADYTFTAADQGKHTFQVTFKTTGIQSLTATDASDSSLKATSSLTVTTVAQVVTITGLNQNVAAGGAQTLTVTLTDNFGNIATGYTGTIRFASTDGKAVLPAEYTFTAADQGKHTVQVTFKSAGAQSVTITDKADSALTATANVNVTTSAPVVAITGLPQTSVAGTGLSFTVSITDAFGNVITDYVGTVHFTSTDAQAGLPADYTFTTADQGRHTFQITFKTTGAQSLTVTDTSDSSLTGTGSLTITTVAQVVTISGLSQNSGAGATQTITVTLTDNFGNIATGYVGSIRFTSTDGKAVLPADYTFTAADQGQHTFQITFKTAGTQSLTISDKANGALIATANLNVTTSAPIVAITGLPQSSVAGAVQSFTVAITDAFGNAITGYTGTVHFTSTDAQAGLPADYTFTSADQGQHTFQVTFKTTGTQSLTATDTSDSSLTATDSLAVTTAAQVVTISGLSQNATAGAVQTITVTLTDSFGNIATGYIGTIRFISTDDKAVLPVDYTFTAADQGKHTFQLTFKTAGAQSLTIADQTTSTLAATANVNITTAAPVVAITGLPQSSLAGASQSFTVTVTDAFGNMITGYTGTVHFTSTDAQAGLPTDYTFTAADQGQHAFEVTFKTTGSQSLMTSDGTLTATSSLTVTTVAQIVTISGLSQNAAAGVIQTVTVTLTDSFGNIATGYTGTIRFTSSDGRAVLPGEYTFSAADQGQHTFQITFKTTGSQSVTITDTNDGGLTAAASVNVTTSAQNVSILGLPTTARAGAALSFTVSITDAFGNIITGYVGTVHFTSTDGRGVLPADYTFTAADQGQHTFEVSFKTTGTQSLTVTDAGNAALTASASLTVTTVAQIVTISGLGQNANTGAVQTVTVTLTDSFGNIATGHTGTIHFTSSDGQAVLPVDYTFTAADLGKHTFQVTFKTSGVQSLTATDSGDSSLTATSSLSVNALAQVLSISGWNSSAVAGTAQTVTVTLTDNFGNIATSFVGTIHFASTDGRAELPADVTFTTADAGQHTFQITFKTTGTQSISITDKANATLIASANATVTSSAQRVILIGLPQTTSAGTGQTFTVSITDNFGNVIIDYVGTVRFSSTDGQATLPSDYTFTSADQGQHVFQATFKTTGSQSIALSDIANSSLSASATLDVTTVAQVLTISGLNPNSTAGSVQTVTVTLTDSFGNIATGYTGTIRFTSSDGRSLLPVDYTFTAADQGQHTFQITLKTTGSQTISITDKANAALTADASVTVTSSAQLMIIIGLPQTTGAGAAQSFTVSVTDQFGNVITNYVGTIHFTSTDGQAALPADYTFTAADQGQHDFQATFKTTGTQSIALADISDNTLNASATLNVTTVAQMVTIRGLNPTAAAGAVQTLTVTLTDSFGNIATGYTGTIHFTSTDGRAVLPADYTFTAGDQGQHTFQVTFTTTGLQSLAINDLVDSSLTDSTVVTVTTLAQNLIVIGLPVGSTAGATQTITVSITDNFGNVITGYVGTLHFSSTDGRADLPADYTFTAADAGQHSFQVTFKTTGTQSLTVADTIDDALSATNSLAITTVAQIVTISGLNPTAVAGAVQTVTVTFTDSFGNIASGYTGTLHLTSSDGQAILPADYTFTTANQGQHTFQVTFKTSGQQSLSIADTADNTLVDTADVVVTTFGQNVILTGLPSSSTAGAAQSFSISITDDFGNVIKDFSGTIHFTSTDGQAVLPADYTFTSADQGQHSFQATFKTTGSQSLTITDTLDSTLTASATVNVTTTAQRVVVTGLSQSTAAGSIQNFTITVTDDFGNVITDYVGTVRFTSTDGQAALPINYTFTAADRGQHTFQVTFKTSGSQSLTSADVADNTLAASADVNVTTSGRNVIFTGLPSSSAAGAAQAFSISITDNFGNVIKDFAGTIHFTSSDGQAVLPADFTFTAADQGQRTFQATFKTTGSQSLTITDTLDNTLTASATVNVTTTAQHVVVSGLSEFATAGSNQTITLTVTDEFGNVITDYAGTVRFTSTDGQASLPVDYTFTPADQGQHTVQVTFKTTGVQTLTVADTTDDTLVASASLTVSTIAQLLIVIGLSQQTSAGTTQNITVVLLDNFGNVVTNYTGTIRFTSSDSNAALPADYTFTDADQGQHTFQITFKTTGSQSLVIADTSDATLQSAADVTVTTTAQQVIVSGLDENAIAGAVQSVTITVMDNYGNIVTDYLGTIHFGSSDSRATLPVDYTFTAADQGKRSFSVTYRTAGTQSLTITDLANSALSGSASVNVTTSAQIVTITGLPQQTSVGTTQSFTVTIVDSFGNVLTGYVGTIQFASTDGKSVLPANYTFTAADKGKHAFEVTFKTPGSQSLAITDTVDSSLKTTATVSVTTTATQVVLAGIGQGALAGSAQAVTITLMDDFGNVVTDYAGTILFSSSDVKAGLPADYTFTAADLGKHTFQVTFKTTGSQSLTIADNSNGRLQASADVTVTSTAQRLVVTGLSQNPSAGTAQTITIAFLDNFGNVATGYTGKIHFSTSDQKAGLPADYTFTAADQGKHTFQITFKSTGPQALAVVDTSDNSLNAVINVTVGNSAQLMAVRVISQNVVAGMPQTVTVLLTDSFGNVATDFRGKIHFTSTDAKAGLPADYTFTAADKGKHTFLVTFKTTGIQILTLTDAANSRLSGSASVNVTSTAQKFVLTGLPQNATAATAQSVTITVTDNFGNVVTGYTGKVHFTSSDAQAILPADYTFTTADKGKHTFQVTLKTSGSQSLRVNDLTNSTLIGNANVVVNAAAQNLVLTGISQSTVAGAQQTVTIKVTDSFGNPVTSYRGTLRFTSSDSQATLPVNYTFTDTDQGQHTFTLTLKTVGTQSITVVDVANNAIQSTVSGIAVTADQSTAAVRLQLSGPTNLVAGQSALFTITAFDAQGRVASGYRGTIFWLSSDQSASGARGFAFTAGDQGKHTFAVTFNSVGSQSLTIFDQQNFSMVGTVAGINVASQTVVASSLTALMASPVSAGSMNALTIMMLDAQGRLVTDYRGTLHFQSTDANAVLPEDYTFTADDQGTHLFTLRLNAPGLQTLTITDGQLTANLSIVVASTGRNWTGNGPDALWSNPLNWEGGITPKAGDTVVFKGSANQTNSTYDLGSDIKLKSIVLTGANIRIAGGDLTVTDSIDATRATGVNTIQAGVILGGKVQILGGVGQTVFSSPINVNAFTLTVDALNSNVVFGNTLAGTGGLILASGTLTLAGLGANTISGTVRIDSGVLQLGQSGGTALSGRLIIGSSQGNARSASVVFQASNQIAVGSSVTVNATGLLDLSGQNNSFGALVLAGGQVETGTGNLTLEGDLTASSGNSALSGIVTIAGADRVLNVGSAATLNVTAAVNGSGSLSKTGPGTLILAGTSQFAGTMTVAAGSLALNGSLLSSQVVVSTGAIISGTGQLGSLVLQGGVYQSDATGGSLSVQGGVAFVNNSMFVANLANSGSNQLVCSGQIALTGTILKVSFGFHPAAGARFILASASQGISGAFAGSPEGAVMNVDGVNLRITYSGGVSGRDVVLTAI